MKQHENRPDSLETQPHLGIGVQDEAFFKFIEDYLAEPSQAKKTVNHTATGLMGAEDTIFGSMLVGGSWDIMPALYKVLSNCIIAGIQDLAKAQGYGSDFCQQLAEIGAVFQTFSPFAHRTTVMKMLEKHSHENTDQWLAKNFALNCKEIQSVGLEPKEMALSVDPHYIDRKPQHRNQETKKVMVGGLATLRVGFQFNVAHISPYDLIPAMDLSTKRQKDQGDLGSLAFSMTYGKSLQRMQSAGMPAPKIQGDRQLNTAVLFGVSQNHWWPNEKGEIGELTDYTADSYLTVPWMTRKIAKEELLLQPDFKCLTINQTKFRTTQYGGNSPLSDHFKAIAHGVQVTVESAVIVVTGPKGNYKAANETKIRSTLMDLNQKIAAKQIEIENIRSTYNSLPTQNKKILKPRGLEIKLNSTKKDPLSNETIKAWTLRVTYQPCKAALKRLQKTKASVIRNCHVFEIGVSLQDIETIKSGTFQDKQTLIQRLIKCCNAYRSRWGVESTVEVIEYDFPLNYHGTHSTTQKRIFALQAIIFNRYRLNQIERIKAHKPWNWHPFDPKNPCCRRALSPKEQRSYSTRAFLLDGLTGSLTRYFKEAICQLA